MKTYKVWPKRTDNPYTEVLNKSPKFVASTTLREPLPWQNSTLLGSSVPEAIVQLKSEAKKDIVILGSGELVRSLMKHNLVDEYVLHIFPLILGSGRRLFDDNGAFASLRLVDSTATTTGVLIATYQTAEPKEA